MRLRPLKGTDLKVSPVGLGTVKFGRNEGVKYPTSFDIPDMDELSNLLALAKEIGINTLDTAPAYGLSEERLGELLKGQRDDWVIIGKAGEYFENGESQFDFSPDGVERGVEDSLKKLKTDRIDVLMLHSDGNDTDILNDDDLIQTLHDLKAQGLVTLAGASTKTAVGGLMALEKLDTVMCMYTSDYQDEKPVLDYAQSTGQPVFLKKALSSGHAANPKDALEFAFSHPAVTSAIIGTITPANLRKNVQNFIENCQN
jgi:aryl-alcohol dehydrogenase-like predicted oxidoreductase